MADEQREDHTTPVPGQPKIGRLYLENLPMEEWNALIAERDALKAQVALLEKADNVYDVTVNLDEKVLAEVLALRDALRGLLPYVDTSKASAFRAIEAAEKALGEGTDGS